MVSLMSQSKTGLPEAAIWFGVLILGVIILGASIVVLKRLLFGSEGVEPATPWTLQQLTALRDRGELTIAEYDRLRNELIAQMNPPASRTNSPPEGSAGVKTGRRSAGTGDSPEPA